MSSSQIQRASSSSSTDGNYPNHPVTEMAAGFDPLAEFGIPKNCVCGGEPKLDVFAGRHFYHCRSESSGIHTWKWWDDTITEDVGRMKFDDLPNIKTVCHCIQRDFQEVECTVNHYVKSVEEEIMKVEDFKLRTEAKIEKLEKLVRESSIVISASQMKVLLATLVIVATAYVLFKYL